MTEIVPLQTQRLELAQKRSYFQETSGSILMHPNPSVRTSFKAHMDRLSNKRKSSPTCTRRGDSPCITSCAPFLRLGFRGAHLQEAEQHPHKLAGPPALLRGRLGALELRQEAGDFPHKNAGVGTKGAPQDGVDVAGGGGLPRLLLQDAAQHAKWQLFVVHLQGDGFYVVLSLPSTFL
jgi:hypothetical protein